MKKFFVSAALSLILIQSAIFAQEEVEQPVQPLEAKEDKPTTKEGKIHQFGLTIKRMDYTYIPAEYHNSHGFNYFTSPFARDGNLKGNKQVTFPFAFSYYNKNWNLFIEASHYKVTYNDMYNRRSEVVRSYSNGQLRDEIWIYDQQYATKTRRESKINFYKQAHLNESNSFFYGIGIRNIYRESYYKSINRLEYEYKDSLNTYGLQFFLKYQYQITSSLKLNLSSEPFITSGIRNRHWGDPYVRYSFFYPSPYPNGIANTIYGVETDIQFSYSLNENLNLLIGYNYIHTKIKTGDIVAVAARSRYLVETSDSIYGYYIGVNAKF